MTVRGGKNRLLVCAGAALFLLALVLLYHNAATRLEDARDSFNKCHSNEKSLSTQLQVILEYKNRLEKSLQQEKSEHAQTKDDLKTKVDEERQNRERENLESINKFTALQQQYKLLQSQHEDVTLELGKAKQQVLSLEDDRARLQKQITSLTQENKHLQDERENDNSVLREKLSEMEADYEKLKKAGTQEQLVKEKADLQRELAECLRSHTSTTPRKAEGGQDEALVAPVLAKRSSPVKSSTAENRVEVVSGADVNFKTSTPMINPDAVQSQVNGAIPPPHQGFGRIPIVPVPYPDQRPVEESELRPPAHVPLFRRPPFVAGPVAEQQPLGEPEVQPAGQQQIPHPPPPAPLNKLARKHAYYEEYDKEAGKDEGEDDDVDQIDYNAGDKHENGMGPPVNVNIADKHDSVMVNPK